MPRNDDLARFELQLSPEQYAELKRISAERHTPIADLIRAALVLHYATMPDNCQVAGMPRTYRNVPDGNGTQTEHVPERTVTREKPSKPTPRTSYHRGDPIAYDGFTWAIAAVLNNGLQLERRAGKLTIPLFVLFDDLSGTSE